jgi:Ca2+-binding EF-hand superfamily protein
MNARLREQRTQFLLFLGALYLSLMAALPLMSASMSQMRSAAQARYAAAEPTFEELDRNHDGYVDRREAEWLPGLAAIFAAADRRADGRLDKVEYAKALALLGGRP